MLNLFLSPASLAGAGDIETHRVCPSVCPSDPSRWVCPGDISVTVYCRWMKLHSWIEYTPKLCLARLLLAFSKKCNLGDLFMLRMASDSFPYGQVLLPVWRGPESGRGISNPRLSCSINIKLNYRFRSSCFHNIITETNKNNMNVYLFWNSKPSYT